MIDEQTLRFNNRDRLRDDYFIGEVPRSEPDWRCLRGSG